MPKTKRRIETKLLYPKGRKKSIASLLQSGLNRGSQLSDTEKIVHSESLTRKAALEFVGLVGVVKSFADMTYEGARSITGPYLAVLGASGRIVEIVAGLASW
jgi:hypothetical protein